MTKKKVLCWSDSAIAGTGFGVVSKNVLTALHESGLYDIHHLAINFHGDFTDPTNIPWQQQPARLLDPRDPHGTKMFIKTLANGNYDYVWICNDLFVTHQVAQEYSKVITALQMRNRKVPICLYYYPVDCCVPSDGCDFLKLVDLAVCYTDHGRAETLKTLPEARPILHQVPHGADTKTYRPLTSVMQGKIKQAILGCSPDATVVINVNRNNVRKQIQYSLLAFKEFQKLHPNSVMYIHSAVKDQGGNLLRAIESLGLNPKKDVIFPSNYSSKRPVSAETLNQLYNMADMFLTTHLGEGWGLTITESMAAGTPVIVPDNTCMPQQVGSDGDRGYMYPCNDELWIDPSGYRKKGLIPDIVDAMVRAKDAGSKWENPVTQRARTWAEEHHWSKVTKQWIKLFEVAAENKAVEQNTVSAEEI